MISPHRIFSLLIFNCLNKVTKVKCECLEICAEIIKTEEVNQTFFKEIKALIKHMNGADQITKNAILSIIIEVYKKIGDELWDLFGDVPENIYNYFHDKLNDMDIEVDIGDLKSSNFGDDNSFFLIKMIHLLMEIMRIMRKLKTRMNRSFLILLATLILAQMKLRPFDYTDHKYSLYTRPYY